MCVVRGRNLQVKFLRVSWQSWSARRTVADIFGRTFARSGIRESGVVLLLAPNPVPWGVEGLSPPGMHR